MTLGVTMTDRPKSLDKTMIHSMLCGQMIITMFSTYCTGKIMITSGVYNNIKPQNNPPLHILLAPLYHHHNLHPASSSTVVSWYSDTRSYMLACSTKIILVTAVV